MTNTTKKFLHLLSLILIAIGTTARNYVLAGFGAFIAAVIAFRIWSKTPGGSESVDRVLMTGPVAVEFTGALPALESVA